MIDGAVVPWEVVPAIKLHELVQVPHRDPGQPTLYTATFFLAMNKAKYEGLPADAAQGARRQHRHGRHRWPARSGTRRGAAWRRWWRASAATPSLSSREAEKARWMTASQTGGRGLGRRDEGQAASTAPRCWMAKSCSPNTRAPDSASSAADRRAPGPATRHDRCRTRRRMDDAVATQTRAAARAASHRAGGEALAAARRHVALAVAAIVVVSVLRRWLFSQPVPGDFELARSAPASRCSASWPMPGDARQHRGRHLHQPAAGARARRASTRSGMLVYAVAMALRRGAA